ncbi:response regulator transcription factor [Hyphomonas sp.]|uniref:response regulator transcription factor n=1 Tax=Hyphomonas sp. TaxID=87 RepID=UPI00391CA00C
MKIILVEDDTDLIETIKLGWPDGGDRIDSFVCYADLKPVLFSGGLAAADCVILDMTLPDASGTQIIADIRRVSDVPIIVLSGWGGTEFRADMINQGIEDYVLKPLSVKELHARVARLARRRPPGPAAGEVPVQINGVTFDRARRTLRRGELEVELTHAESQLLGTLVDASGRVVSRDDLYLKAFGRPHKDGEKVLETYVSRLRNKLEQLEGGAENTIQTARGAGYRMIVQTSGG